MATASKIHLSPKVEAEVFLPGVTAESADTASKLLQENHERHHIFFNQSGFHNHIAHHLLTILALAATPEELRKGYSNNASYQRAPVPVQQEVVDDMHDPSRFKTYLGNEKYYHDFLVFFKGEIDQKGWEHVLNEYVFKRDERADDMLVRLYAGFLHPIIHLGFGIEFAQPAVIAEALAQAAVHDNWVGNLFYKAEDAAQKAKDGGSTKSIIHLLEEIRRDEKLNSAAHSGDGNKIRDGILKRAPNEMIEYASQYQVKADELEKKTAEMVNACVYYTATAQHPPKQVKFDFFYMHCVNSSIFFSSFLKQSWLSNSNKIRLLEWKVRLDLAMYASRGCPKLDIEEITKYQPRADSSWSNIFRRVNSFEDDGHASKLVRALKHGEDITAKFDDSDGFLVKGDMWRILGNMVVDSVEAGGPTWVRGAGFSDAWDDVPEREQARL